MWMYSSPHTLRWVLSGLDKAEKSRFYYLGKLPCDGKILLKEWYLNNWSPRALKLQGPTVISSTKSEATPTKYSDYLRMVIWRSHSQPPSRLVSLTVNSLCFSSVSCCKIIPQLMHFLSLKAITSSSSYILSILSSSCWYRFLSNLLNAYFIPLSI